MIQSTSFLAQHWSCSFLERALVFDDRSWSLYHRLLVVVGSFSLVVRPCFALASTAFWSRSSLMRVDQLSSWLWSTNLDVSVQQHQMATIHVVDRKNKKDYLLTLNGDGCLELEYLRSVFPWAIGLQYLDPTDQQLVGWVTVRFFTGNESIAVPNFSVRRVNGLFRCDWSTDIVYEPVYTGNGMACHGSFLLYLVFEFSSHQWRRYDQLGSASAEKLGKSYCWWVSWRIDSEGRWDQTRSTHVLFFSTQTYSRNLTTT